jgi:hypothetical protein
MRRPTTRNEEERVRYAMIGRARVLLALVAGGLTLICATTALGAALPDNRAYELVSPAAKSGGDILLYSGATRAATTGDALGFASVNGFADARSTPIETEYVAERTGQAGTSGWATHAITPPQQPVTFLGEFLNLGPSYVGDFSSDLSSGVFRAWTPLTDASNVADVLNLYVRKDLLTPGVGSYQLVTDCPACSAPLDPFAILQKPELAGASADFSHVIFESTLPLTPEATSGQPQLFEWDNGTLRLVGVLPDSGCGSPPCVADSSVPGQGTTTNVDHVISEDGSRIIFSTPSTGALYMRVDHTSTVQLNATERDAPDPTPAPATYWDASAGADRVFFTSAEALTNDAPINGDSKLYMYDTTADSSGHHLTFLSTDHEPSDDASTSDSVAGALGASRDGSYVYFLGGGQLVQGAPTEPLPGADDRLYVWHDGELRYIGALASDDQHLNLEVDWQLRPKESRVTPDGRHLLFLASTGVGLTGYDHGTCPIDNNTTTGKCRELYVYSFDTQHVECASCNPGGAPATAHAQDVVRDRTGNAVVTLHQNRVISDDGRWVYFSTQEALVPQDTNGKFDAYEYDTQTHTVHLLSSGTGSADSYAIESGASGRDAFIVTRDRLVGWDTDNSYDVYDLRVGGGFPEPPAPPPACGGDTCHGAASPAPSPAAAGSALFQGAGNVRAVKRHRAVRCKRGYVRKRVRGRLRCVRKRRRHHHRRAHRASQQHRGGGR